MNRDSGGRDQGSGVGGQGSGKSLSVVIPDPQYPTPDPQNEKRDKLVADLKGLQSAPDPYNAHKLADALLLAYIDDEEVRAAFDAIQKWYM